MNRTGRAASAGLLLLVLLISFGIGAALALGTPAPGPAPAPSVPAYFCPEGQHLVTVRAGWPVCSAPAAHLRPLLAWKVK
jgi:hypothetical protein